MRLTSPFFRLPLRFDARRLAEEIAQFSEAEWRPHPQGHKGNTALALLSVGGDPDDDGLAGPIRPTPHLARCPYIQQVLAALGAPIGRTRLMRIAGNHDATPHIDTNYYWAERVRVHVPIVTEPSVRFCCGHAEVFMAAGECWIFDNWRLHNVINANDTARIHLVADSVGSPSFWQLVAEAEKFPGPKLNAEQRLLPYMPEAAVTVPSEAKNFPVIMSPVEARRLLNRLLEEVTPRPQIDPARAAALKVICENFITRWSELWQRFSEMPSGWALNEAELARLAAALAPFVGQLQVTSGLDVVTAIEQWIVRAAFNPKLAQTAVRPTRRIERPVFIVAAPRSGSTFLFETLSRAGGAYTPGGESHEVFERIPELAPQSHDFSSNRLLAEEATAPVVATLERHFLALLRDRDGQPPPAEGALRLLEKTPKNALRIPFLAAAFADARFIYLYREPHENLASIIEAWRSGKFVTYPKLPGWSGLLPWSLLLIPEWQALRGKSMAAIAAAQWECANRTILDDLATLPKDRWTAVSYAELSADPDQTAARLCAFAELAWDRPLTDPLPLAKHTLTAPDANKWKEHAPVIEPLLPSLADTVRRAHAACETQASPAVVRVSAPAAVTHLPVKANAPATAPLQDTAVALASVHTANFPNLLRELGSSLFISTYQAGKLVILRADGDQLNTHFRNFPRPMGLALDAKRLAVGTEFEVREFRNVPVVSRRLEPAGKHDAVFLPRRSHVTGDVQIHELAWAGDELWFVNTSFSCLCTRDREHSFVPRWQPRFITALAPEDRCHLNGLAIVDGRPGYVTALGESDEARGWRGRKRDGGVIIDVASQEIVSRGLSMPHSPRWHGGQLWVLNSGQGGLGTIDRKNGRYQEVARLPGFARGLDFIGRYAFVGLSQVRESATFSDIAIAEQPLAERACGVWVVDTVSGAIIGFTKFSDAVQEIFSVQIGENFRFPDIINDDREVIGHSFVVPDAALASVPSSLK